MALVPRADDKNRIQELGKIDFHRNAESGSDKDKANKSTRDEMVKKAEADIAAKKKEAKTKESDTSKGKDNGKDS